MKKISVALVCLITAATVSVCAACGGKKKAQYTVTFDSMGGTTISSYKLEAGSAIKKPKDPQKEMFTFDGWYWDDPKTPGTLQKFKFGTKISGNITLYAGWIGDVSVQLEYNANSGEFENGYTYVVTGAVGAQLSAPSDNPTREGYVFDGWYTEPECYSKFNLTTFPSADTAVYAKWAQSSKYAYVSYYGNGELIEVKPVKLKATVPTDVIEGDDLVIGDWYTDAKLTKPYTVGTASGNLSLYTTYYTKGLSIKNGVVNSYDGSSRDVVVPSVYDGRAVTGIGANAFYRTGELVSITSVTLPKSVQRISDYAFYDCQYLVSVNLSDNVTMIGRDAFYNNRRLKSIGDISSVTSIGSGAFNGCLVLESITLPDALTSIGEYTFNDCRFLTEIDIPQNVEEIGEYAFSGCAKLKTVTLNRTSKVAIAEKAFDGCDVATIYVPGSLLADYQVSYAALKDKFSAK